MGKSGECQKIVLFCVKVILICLVFTSKVAFSEQLPDNKNTLLKSAQFEKNNSSYSKAILFYKKLLKNDPKNIQFKIDIADCYYNLNMFSTAKKYYSSVLNSDKLNSTALLKIARIYEFENQNEKAINFLSILIKSHPDFLSYSSLGRIYVKLKLYDKARLCFGASLKFDGRYIPSWLGLGNLFAKTNEFRKAEKIFRIVKIIDKESYIAYYNLATIYCRQKKYDKAVREYLSLLKLIPNSARVYYHLGELEYKLSHNSKAIKYLSRAIELDSKFFDAIYLLVNIYTTMGESVCAKALVKDIAYLNSTDTKTLSICARLFQKVGAFEDAKSCYENILKINPKDIDVNKALGYLYITLEDYNKAWDILAKIAVNSDDVILLSNMSFLCAQRGDYKTSIKYANKALLRDVNSVAAYEHLAYAYAKEGLFREALEIYDKIVMIDPLNITSMVYKGIILYEMGLYRESLYVLNNSVRFDMCPVVAYFYIGNIYSYYLKDNKEALNYFLKYRKYLENSGDFSSMALVNEKISILTQEVNR